MKAEPISVGKVLSENQRFVVPIYQRTYTWTAKKQLEPLWGQVESKANEVLAMGKTAFPHYMGSLLVIPEGEAAFGQVQAYDVVDGQQRITTFHLLFAALRAIARDLGYTDLAKSIENLLLLAADTALTGVNGTRYKLQPTKQDREVFRHLVDYETEKLRQVYLQYFYSNGKHKKTKAPPVLAAYSFFYERTWSFLEVEPARTQERFRSLNEAVFQSFRFIVITLSKDDDPQVIFETLNTGGEPLAAMDLVRNDIFLRAARRGESPEALMDEYWSIFDLPFWKEPRTQGRLTKPTMDFFLTHALGAETGKMISPSEVYSEYKSYSKARNTQVVEDELRSIIKYVEPYKILASPGRESELDELGSLLSTFDTSTAYPAILIIATTDIEQPAQDHLYKLIGSYVVRRALCGLTSKNYNIVFGELTSQFRGFGVSVETLKAFMESKKGSEAARFPSDRELTQCILERDQYNSLATNRLRFILTQLELASQDKFSAAAGLKPGLWVEHIMPQGWRKSWPLASGKMAPEAGALVTNNLLLDEISTRDRLVQNLGNLTLLTPASNVSAGYATFEDKKGRLVGSLTSMNAALSQLGKWDESAIVTRSQQLAFQAAELWPSP